MDTKLPASLSPARGLTNSASFPIRAPPTNYFTDEDSGKESSLDGSDDGFVTGDEEEFDTASERQLGVDPVEDVVVGSVEEVKVGSFAGGGRPVAKLSGDDDDVDEEEVVDEPGDGTESESIEDDAVENRALVVQPDNGVLHGVHEEPSMADGVSESEAIFYDSVDQLISNDDRNAQSGEVVDDIPEPEKRVEEFDASENEVEEPRIEDATLSPMSSQTSLQDTVEEVAYADVNEDWNNDESSFDRNSEMKLDAIIELTLDAIVELTSEDSALEEKPDVENEENAVGLKGVSVRDEVPLHADSDQKLEQGGAFDQSITVASSSQESIKSETKEITDSDSFTKQNTSVRELDVEEHNDMDNYDEKEMNEPIPISAIDEEKRYSEPMEKDVNVVKESILVSKEDHRVVVEDSNTKEPSGDDIIEEEREEELGSVRNGDDSIGVSGVAVRIIKELERSSANCQDFSWENHGEVVSESEEEEGIGEEGDGKQLFDSAALAALLEAASSAGADSNLSSSSAKGHNRFLSIQRPAGLGLSAPSLKPTLITSRPNITTNADLDVVAEDDGDMSEEEKKLKEKIHQIRVKFLRLVQRLGQYPEDAAASQVLYRLSLAEGIRNGRTMALSMEAAKRIASQLEAEGKEGLDFSFNFLVIGKAGSGKSATINSIFNEGKAGVGAFEPTTPCVKEITGIVDGVKVRVIDTPGLKSSGLEQGWNRKTLYAVRKFIQKCPPDVVLYVDRLDTQTRDFNEVPLLKAISSVLGSSIWHNAIVTLTHAATAPPDGANGLPMSYEIFVGQRSQVVQRAIRQAAGDLRLMAPVALVENHPSCRVNREGERILPNGLAWRPQLLLMCYSLKIISEANSLMKLQNASVSKLFERSFRSLPTAYLLSSFLQSRVYPKILDEQGAEIEDSEIDLADLSDSEQEGEDEYDQLPPFKPLRKAQIEKLSEEQKKAYSDEYDYRVKLLERKLWKEDLRRLKQVKKMGNESQIQDGGDVREGNDFDQENGASSALSVPLLDFALPPSFDGDNPSYRYRYLQPTSGLLARPVYDPHRWDHDYGFDGVSLENSLAVASRFPAAISVQVTKDKKDFNIHLDSSLSAKLGENGSSLAAFDIQTMGKQLAYTFVGEAKCKTFKRNKTAAGVSIIFLGENVATGLKIEDQISIGKRVCLVGSAGAMRSQGDTMAYGANFEARLQDKDFPVGQDHQSSLGLSLLKAREDLALVANLQSQFSIGRSSKVNVRVGLNNKKSGQITVRTSSCEQLQIALMGLLPITASILRTFFPNSPNFNN